MAKLAKSYYKLADGGRRLNSYMWAIPKALVEQSGIDPDKDIHAFQEHGKIILEQAKKDGKQRLADHLKQPQEGCKNED